jgi:4,5-DOPA dioxygenase extradiol
MGAAGAAALAQVSACRLPTPPSGSSSEERVMTKTGPKNDTNKSGRMPVLFVGHGSPMNAIEDTPFSRAWQQLGRSLPTPKAVLAISAHWYVDGTYVLASERPKTIHDFGGFPQKLFDMQYPAPGHPTVAARVRAVLGDERARLSEDWGLDHGTWSVLVHVFPEANVPVLQLSIDRSLSPQQSLDLARDLRELRDEGVLIVGSGNITHNLRDAMRRMQTGDTSKAPWAHQFDADVVSALEQRDAKRLALLWPGTDHGRMSHPTADHWLPMLYAFGATTDDDKVSYPVEGFDLGSLSMRSVRFG